MKKKVIKNILLIKDFDSDIKLLALLCVSAVLRKDKNFIEILNIIKEKKINRVKIYESLLQVYLFAGFPTALYYLKILNKIIPSNKKKNIDLVSKTNLEKGIKTCKKIYGRKFDKLIENVKDFSPELSKWLILEGYGKVLSRKGLKLSDRELIIISILSVQKFESQLLSHINGAVRQKIKIADIKECISNLGYFGNKSYTRFGLKILDKYKIMKSIKF